MMASEMLALALLAYAAFALPGCYEDAADARLLAHTVCDKTGGCTALTLEYCAAACRALKYGIAGVEAGHACFCGNELAPPVTLVSPLQCCSPCTGNGSDACGDVYRLLAFPVDAPPQAPPQMCPQFQPGLGADEWPQNASDDLTSLPQDMSSRSTRTHDP